MLQLGYVAVLTRGARNMVGRAILPAAGFWLAAASKRRVKAGPH